MEFENLIEFLLNQMTMSHIYQPLLIRSLVESGGTATIRQLANYFLSQDESQIQYYEKRIKEMPLRVLVKHGIVSKDGDLVSLNAQKMTLEQKAQIKMICEQKIQEYVTKRGLGIWDYRLLDKDPIPDIIYYRVMKDGDCICALCGAKKKDRPVHLDYIKPRSRRGKTVYENLQVLCSKANQAKSNKNDTDNYQTFRFCEYEIIKRKVDQNVLVWAIIDRNPVTEGNHLIIPKCHKSSQSMLFIEKIGPGRYIANLGLSWKLKQWWLQHFIGRDSNVKV